MVVIKAMEFDVYRCCICNRGMNIISRTSRKCKNGCSKYYEAYNGGYRAVTLFNENEYYISMIEHEILSPAINKTIQKHEKLLLKEIEYWKENDRYLIKVLGGL